jgi:hypothetical protein
MNEMTFIDLSENQLTGTLPTTLLANATGSNKIVVDLSSNLISGIMPTTSLSRFPRLSINLADNRITCINSKDRST